MKKLLSILLCSLLVCTKVYGATEFVCTINKSGQDFDTLTLWEAQMQANLTSALVRVYDVSSVTGTVADDATVVGDINGYTADVY